MALAFKFYYLIAVLQNAKLELLKRESSSQWVKNLLEKKA